MNLLPCCGTIRKSPSAFAKAQFSMDALAAYLWWKNAKLRTHSYMQTSVSEVTTRHKRQLEFCWLSGKSSVVSKQTPDHSAYTLQVHLKSYMWTAYPCRRNGLPAPQIVNNPSMKSVLTSGMSSGFHRNWVGVTVEFDESVKSLMRFSWAGCRGQKGSWVTDGFMRYSQLWTKMSIGHQRSDWIQVIATKRQLKPVSCSCTHSNIWYYL